MEAILFFNEKTLNMHPFVFLLLERKNTIFKGLVSQFLNFLHQCKNVNNFKLNFTKL